MALMALRKQAFFDQDTSQSNAVGAIHSQNANGYAADCRSTDKNRLFPEEMLIPVVISRIKKSNDRRDLVRIKSRDIWPFEAIAVSASERQVGKVRFSAMLDSNDVIDLKAQMGGRLR
jgi:hypothetical protein